MNLNPTRYDTDLNATIELTNEQLAETAEQAERHTAEGARRAIRSALQNELGVGMTDIEIDIEADSRRAAE